MLSLKEQAIEFISTIPDNKIVYIMDMLEGMKGFLHDDAKQPQQASLEGAPPSAMGIFRKYANPSLIPNEKDAWGNAVREKYADH
ncbi:MAG: hypothetical protein FWG09_01040 [Synergistaceae bacterium]|nr:hypothetical protein [Synergistaceae bacterium]